MGKRARMEGFNTLDHWDHYDEAAAQLAEWLAEGKLRTREHVLDGLDRAPEALVRLFQGDHLGKLVVASLTSCVSTPIVGHDAPVVAGFRARLDLGEELEVGSAAGWSLRRAPARSAAGPDRGSQMRKVAPCPGRGLHLGAPAVRLGDRGDDREPEAGAAARRAS